MRRVVWIGFVLLFAVSGMLFTVSCAKKTISSEAGVSQAQDEEAQRLAAEKARQDELARQDALAQQRALEERRLEEERRSAEARQREVMAERERFVNADVHFDFDSSVLSFEAQQVLQDKAQWLRKNSGVSVIIEGHCDERGTNEYNLALGDRRAQSAKAFLVDLGISASRLDSVSYGEERPLDAGHDEAAWSKNRRAHFELQ